MAELKYEEAKPSSKLPIVILGGRIVTMASLVVSIGIMKANHVTYTTGNNGKKGSFNYLHSPTYKYVLFAMVVGFAYSFLQTPFAIFYVMRGKRLIKHYGFRNYDFYGDKACLVLLATAVGAAFGATVEIRRTSQLVDLEDGFDATDYRAKMRKFCSMAYFSAWFLLVGFLTSTVLSILSSKALSKKKK